MMLGCIEKSSDCFVFSFWSPVKYCVVQHQSRLQTKLWKIRLAAVFFRSSWKICSGNYSANREKP